MSLSHAIFSLPLEAQWEAIRTLARKALAEQGGSPRKRFSAMIRPLLHARHSGGGTKEELAKLQYEWRQLYQIVKRDISEQIIELCSDERSDAPVSGLKQNCYNEKQQP